MTEEAPDLSPAPPDPAPVPSPCTKVCRVEGTVCAGCGRTLDEITRWRTMGRVEQLAVLARLAGGKASS